jgi:hypothetical protein
LAVHTNYVSVYYPLFYVTEVQLLIFAIFSIRCHKVETSNGEVNGERKTYNINTHSLRERNENSSSQSSGGGSPVRKVVSRSKGSENVARAKRKLNTYDIADIIDSEVWYNYYESYLY